MLQKGIVQSAELNFNVASHGLKTRELSSPYSPLPIPPACKIPFFLYFICLQENEEEEEEEEQLKELIRIGALAPTLLLVRNVKVLRSLHMLAHTDTIFLCNTNAVEQRRKAGKALNVVVIVVNRKSYMVIVHSCEEALDS